jgi:hypothetical protein
VSDSSRKSVTEAAACRVAIHRLSLSFLITIHQTQAGITGGPHQGPPFPSFPKREKKTTRRYRISSSESSQNFRRKVGVVRTVKRPFDFDVLRHAGLDADLVGVLPIGNTALYLGLIDSAVSRPGTLDKTHEFNSTQEEAQGSK